MSDKPENPDEEPCCPRCGGTGGYHYSMRSLVDYSCEWATGIYSHDFHDPRWYRPKTVVCDDCGARVPHPETHKTQGD